MKAFTSILFLCLCLCALGAAPTSIAAFQPTPRPRLISSSRHDTTCGETCTALFVGFGGGGDYLSSLGTSAPAPAAMTRKQRKPRKPIVGGNWKCNPVSAASLPELVRHFDGCAQYLDKCDVYVCPSNLHVALVKDSFVPGIAVAPQNCNFAGCGAFTGEMAVDQIQDMGLTTVLIGHSERRGAFGLPTPAESHPLLATKLQYILDQGLQCIFCIGEPLPIREQRQSRLWA